MKNKSHNKRHDRQILSVVHLKEQNPLQEERLRQLFFSKYGISKKKVRIDKKQVTGKIGLEYIASIIAPTVAQLEKGRKTHVDYRNFIV